MKMLTSAFVLLLLSGCAAETKTEAPAPETPPVTTTTQAAATTTTQPPATTTDENQVEGTFAGQVKIDAHASSAMFNYVGPESGDFAPMRFDPNSADIGQKILAVCSDDDECEFTGVVQWLDEAPPENASAIGKIIRVDSVRRIPSPNEQ